jgi:simple sugar transport system permease protein
MKDLFRHHETYVLIIIILVSIVITAINPSYFTLENFFDLLRNYSFLGIFAVGVTFVLISGGIDISFTAIASVAEYIMAFLIIKYGGNTMMAFLIAVVVGTGLGMLNAALIYCLKIPTIITTIATLNIYYGLLSVLSGGKWIYAFPSGFRTFATVKVFTLINYNGASYGLSIITVIWILVIICAWITLRYTTLGRSIYAMGGNPSAARRVGFNIFRVQIFVYSFMGFTAGLAGFVQALVLQTVAPNSIVGKELDVIAAVVLGGASLAGGVGTISGTILGVALIAIMNNGLTLLRISSFWYNVVIGLVILLSVTFSSYRHRLSPRGANRLIGEIGGKP